MAKRRMISASLSTSEKFDTLKTDQARLLFCLLLPHTNDFGIMDATPHFIKASIVPTLENFTKKTIIQHLEDLDAAGLIYYYDYEGEKKLLEIVKFDEHQVGLHKRTSSEYPDHAGRVPTVPGNSGKFREIPPEKNLKEKEFKNTSARGRARHTTWRDKLYEQIEEVRNMPLPGEKGDDTNG